MRKMKYRVSPGCRSSEEAVLLPGYVFFKVPSDIDPFLLFPKDTIRRAMTTDDDQRFARWLFRYDGLLDFSKAYCEREHRSAEGYGGENHEGGQARAKWTGNSEV